MFKKLIMLIKNLFSKQKLIAEKSTVIDNEEYKQVEKNSLRDELKSNYQIYNIKQLYEDDKITENDLTIKQIKDLIKVYKEQINYNS